MPRQSRHSLATGLARASAFSARPSRSSRRITAYRRNKNAKSVYYNVEPTQNPVIRVLKIFCGFDVIRGLYDSLVMVALLILTISLERESTMLKLKLKGGKHVHINLAPGEVQDIENHFECYRPWLIFTVAFAILVNISEAPLAFVLYRGVKKENEKMLRHWLRSSFVIQILNLVINLMILVFAWKMRLNREDLKQPVHNGVTYPLISFMLRVGTFDMTKGTEMVFAYAYIQQLKEGGGSHGWKSRMLGVSNL